MRAGEETTITFAGPRSRRPIGKKTAVAGRGAAPAVKHWLTIRR
jgi:hypothetical protein